MSENPLSTVLSKEEDEKTKTLFESVERKILLFFHCNFTRVDDDNINHCTEANKILLLEFITCIANNYDTCVHDIIVAVLFAFYSLVLLELHGDRISLEEVSRFISCSDDTIEKIKVIYYGIIWGDEPILAEVRRRMLFPIRE